MSKLPKFQEPTGTLPISFVPDATQKYSGTLIPNLSKMSAAEQFEFRQNSPLYQFVQTVSSEEGKKNRQYSGNYYYTPTKDNPKPHWEFVRSEEPLQPMEQTIAEYLPGTGDVAEVEQIRQDFSQGKIGSGLLGAGLLVLPGNWGKIKNKIKGIDWKALRYELDPRYMRVYHATDAPFDINHFHTGTIYDAGLHTSKKPLEKEGNVIYKLYTPKPKFRFFDTWTNGAMMFNPEHKFSKGMEFEITPANEDLLKKSNVSYTTEYSNFYQKPAIKINEDKTVNLSRLIFPNNPELQQSLSNLALKQKQFITNMGVFNPEYESEIRRINERVSDILSKNGYSVGVYKNANPYETIEDSYSIFDPSAIKYSIRIKEKGGKINGNN